MTEKKTTRTPTIRDHRTTAGDSPTVSRGTPEATTTPTEATTPIPCYGVEELKL